MYCTKCGAKIPALSKFCTECGHKAKSGEADLKKEGGSPRRRALKIIIWLTVFLVIFFGVPFAIYFFTGVSKQTYYKHPFVGFTLFYPKSLKMETPTLPPEAKCKIAAPCFLIFKNPAYKDSVVNWIFVISATDSGVKKDLFVSQMEKSLQVDVSKGEAALIETNGRKVYKYVNDPAKPPQSLAVFYKMLKFDPSQEQSLYVFASGESAVLIGFKKPPAGAPAGYSDYVDTTKLIFSN